jgi:hypothetical protein
MFFGKEIFILPERVILFILYTSIFLNTWSKRDDWRKWATGSLARQNTLYEIRSTSTPTNVGTNGLTQAKKPWQHIIY